MFLIKSQKIKNTTMDQQIQVLYFSLVTKRGDDWSIKEIFVIEDILSNKTP